MYVPPSGNDDNEKEMREREESGKGEGNRVCFFKKEGRINEEKQQESSLEEEGLLECESLESRELLNKLPFGWASFPIDLALLTHISWSQGLFVSSGSCDENKMEKKHKTEELVLCLPLPALSLHISIT